MATKEYDPMYDESLTSEQRRVKALEMANEEAVQFAKDEKDRKAAERTKARKKAAKRVTK